MNNPIIFWDGYGLGVHNSGVFVHGLKIARALEHEAVNPCLVTTEEWSTSMPRMDAAILKDHFLFQKIYNSKLIWPLRVRIAVERYLREQSNHGILHGLANFNLADWNRKYSRLKTVLTVHDLIPLLEPSSVSKALALQFRFGFPRAIAAADRIICVSKWTRDTLLDRYPAVHKKVVVIPNGIDRPKALAPKNKRSGPIKILCVSRWESYKNLELLFEIAKLAGSAFEVNLVTNRHISSPYVRVHQQLTSQELNDLQASVDVYVHPSRYEGYCLPAAEALISGTPVVYLKGSGIDEVVGNQVGFGVAAGSPPLKWIEVIRDAAEFALSSEFLDQLQIWLGKLATWQDAALALKTLYNELYAK